MDVRDVPRRSHLAPTIGQGKSIGEEQEFLQRGPASCFLFPSRAFFQAPNSCSILAFDVLILKSSVLFQEGPPSPRRGFSRFLGAEQCLEKSDLVSLDHFGRWQEVDDWF